VTHVGVIYGYRIIGGIFILFWQ